MSEIRERRNLPPGVERIVLPSGKVRWEVRLDVGVGADRQQKRKRFTNRGDALEFHANTHSDRARGTHVAPASLTVQVAVEEWLAAKRGVRPSTLQGYVDQLRPLVDAVGDLRIQQVRKSDIEAMVQALLKGKSKVGTWRAPTKLPKNSKKVRGPWAASNVNTTLQLCEAVWEDLLRQGVVVRNIPALVERAKGERPEMTVLTAEQTRAVLAVTAGTKLHAAWHLACIGLRRSEVCALPWSRVDLDAGTVSVTEGRVPVSGGTSTSPPKTRRSLRAVPLLPITIDALRAAKERQAADEKRAANLWIGSGLVVVDEFGRGFHPDTLTHSWARVLKDAGLPHVRLHDARHGFASLAHAEGVPLVEIAKWLGHEDAGFTLRTYAHSTDMDLSAAAAKMARVLGPQEGDADTGQSDTSDTPAGSADTGTGGGEAPPGPAEGDAGTAADEGEDAL